MRFREIARMALLNLWQRKLRTALNLIGIIVGCIVLLMAIAGGTGVRQAIHAVFDSSEFTRHIQTYPDVWTSDEPPADVVAVAGEMSDERKERIRHALTHLWKRQRGKQRGRELSEETLATLRDLPHVTNVLPEVFVECEVSLQNYKQAVALSGINPDSLAVRRQIVAGDVFSFDDRDSVLIHEFLAYQLGFRSDEDLTRIIGRELTVEFRVASRPFASLYNVLTKQWGHLTGEEFQQQQLFIESLSRLIEDLDATSLTEDQKGVLRSLMSGAIGSKADTEEQVVTRTFRIAGVFHTSRDQLTGLFRRLFFGFDSQLLVHADVGYEIHQIHAGTTDVYHAVVTVERARHLKEVTAAIREMSCHAHSALPMLESIDRQIDNSAWIIYGIAVAILFTSAIGISNTLIISVLERTPEFGIMKSLGARDSHLVLLMICEGAVLGIAGAAISLFMSRILGLVGHVFLQRYVEWRFQDELNAAMLFQFSILPALIVAAVAVLICVGASILPAWRAARLDPVVAMRRT